jgi:hypothetical protein
MKIFVIKTLIKVLNLTIIVVKTVESFYQDIKVDIYPRTSPITC